MDTAPPLQDIELANALQAAPALLENGEQRPRVIVNGRPELILPNDNQTFSECARVCFEFLGNTGKFFLQAADVVVELLETGNNQTLVEVKPEAFRSKLEKYFELRVSLRDAGREFFRQKLCSSDNAKALLLTDEVRRFLPPIQSVLKSPVFAENERKKLVVLRQGYNPQNGGTYVLEDRHIVETVPGEEAAKALLELIEDFAFATPSDKSRCLAGFISPALRGGRLLKTAFPVDLCEATESQSGKGFRAELITSLYDETPHVLTLPSSSRGVGSLDEKISEAIGSGRGFVMIDNMRGLVDSQLLESAIKGVGSTVGIRRPFSREIQARTDHINWMATSNQAEVTVDMANRSIITRIRKQPDGYRFKEYKFGDQKAVGVLECIRRRRSYLQSCLYAIVRDWHAAGKPMTHGVHHDFREWAGALDWIVQNIFRLPPLLDGHRDQQKRVANKGINFVREICRVLDLAERLNQELTTSEIAMECDVRNVPIPGRARTGPEGHDDGPAAIGRILGPVFKDSEEIGVEEYRIKRAIIDVKREDGKGNREAKLYQVIKVGEVYAPKFTLPGVKKPSISFVQPWVPG